MLVPSKQALALLFNFFAAIFIILINKAVFAKVQFNWPGALTLLHYVVTYGSLAAMKACGAFEPSTKPMTTRMWFLAIVVGVTPCVNNMALEANSVGAYQTGKLLLTPVVVIGEWFMLGKPLSWRRGALLALVTAAASGSMATDFEITWAGAALCLGTWRVRACCVGAACHSDRNVNVHAP